MPKTVYVLGINVYNVYIPSIYKKQVIASCQYQYLCYLYTFLYIPDNVILLLRQVFNLSQAPLSLHHFFTCRWFWYFLFPLLTLLLSQLLMEFIVVCCNLSYFFVFCRLFCCALLIIQQRYQFLVSCLGVRDGGGGQRNSMPSSYKTLTMTPEKHMKILQK